MLTAFRARAGPPNPCSELLLPILPRGWGTQLSSCRVPKLKQCSSFDTTINDGLSASRDKVPPDRYLLPPSRARTPSRHLRVLHLCPHQSHWPGKSAGLRLAAHHSRHAPLSRRQQRLAHVMNAAPGGREAQLICRAPEVFMVKLSRRFSRNALSSCGATQRKKNKSCGAAWRAIGLGFHSAVSSSSVGTPATHTGRLTRIRLSVATKPRARRRGYVLIELQLQATLTSGGTGDGAGKSSLAAIAANAITARTSSSLKLGNSARMSALVAP